LVQAAGRTRPQGAEKLVVLRQRPRDLEDRAGQLYRDGDDRGAVRLRPRAVIRLLLVVQLPDASHMSGHFFLAPSMASYWVSKVATNADC